MQGAPLPSVEAVLDKVKSDGTFDQFRKACLSAVEAEPSMRAYGEQIEVLSRRYLQDHSHKWSDSVTKNEVRAKLKDYIVKMIANPDVGISIPVQNMVENSLEKNGPKILLPQIIDAVTTLEKTARNVSTATSSTASSSEPTNVNSAPEETALADKTELGPLNLPLPISIPGLNSGGGGGNSSRKESVGASESGVKVGSKKESIAEPVTTKTKLKSKTSSDASGSASTTSTTSGSGGGVKEVKQQGGQKSSQSRGNQLGLKTKDTKTVTDDKDEGKEASEIEDSLVVKERGRGNDTSGKVKRTTKEEKAGQSDREPEKQSEKKVVGTEDTAAEPEEGVKKEKEGKDRATKGEPKSVLEEVPEERTEQEQYSTSGTGETKDSVPAVEGSGGITSRRKQAAPKRRSARLASLNEDSADEQSRTTSEKGNGTSKTQEVEEMTNRDKVVPVPESGRKKPAAFEKLKSGTTTISKTVSGRKRLRVLESSSDDESVTTQQQRSSGEDGERGYASETKQQGRGEEEEEEVKEGKRHKRKRVRGQKKRSRHKDSSPPQSQMSESQVPKRQLGQKRSLGVSKDDERHRSSSPVLKKVRTKKQLQEDRKRSPATQKSPSPVVVTRYNRRVKPNRRYTSPRDSDSSLSNDDYTPVDKTSNF